MIISCIKCNKKFNVEDHLIPELGRTLQCGSCSHQWHYIPILIVNENINKNKIEDIIKNDEPDIFDKKIVPNIKNKKKVYKKIIIPNKKKKSKFLSFLLVSIITFVALIVIIDTFRIELSSIFPSLDLYLNSLYNVLTDIFLFVTNLIK